MIKLELEVETRPVIIKDHLNLLLRNKLKWFNVELVKEVNKAIIYINWFVFSIYIVKHYDI